MNKSDCCNFFHSRINEDWGTNTPQSAACINIITYLLTRPAQQLKHITYGSLKTAIHTSTDIELLKAINYLSSERAPALRTHFEYFDSESEEYFELEPKEIKDAQQSGYLISPRTGEAVTDFEELVLLYYTLGEALNIEVIA